MSAGVEMGRLVHRNLAAVLGISSLDDPVCIVAEYTELGDLHQLLSNQTTTAAWSNQNLAQFRLQYTCYFYFYDRHVPYECPA